MILAVRTCSCTPFLSGHTSIEGGVSFRGTFIQGISCPALLIKASFGEAPPRGSNPHPFNPIRPGGEINVRTRAMDVFNGASSTYLCETILMAMESRDRATSLAPYLM